MGKSLATAHIREGGKGGRKGTCPSEKGWQKPGGEGEEDGQTKPKERKPYQKGKNT